MKSKNFLPLLVVIFFAVLASRSLIFQSGYFNMHDDLQMMRQLEMEKCFLDGQIPCRWVPDMGYGFGFPLFNFYPPLPYLIGQLFRIIGFSFVNTVKLTFALSFVVSGVGMYYLSRSFFGRIGGVLSSVFYIWAPYHAVDIYVRGAMNEAWALSSFPFIFYYAYKLITEDKKLVFKNLIYLTLAYSALLLSHNLMVLIFSPFFALWVFILLWQHDAWNRLPKLFISGVWAFAVSAFFTFPAIFENKFTQLKTQLIGYYDYTAHFVSINQLLFSRFWGYGPSVWVEAEDGMSFQIGHVHWILSLIVGIFLLWRFMIGKGNILKRIKKDKLLAVTGFMFFVGWFSAYMTHLKSISIYQAFPQLSYIQFSWRFLTIVIFAFSFIVGFLPGIIANIKERVGLFLKIALTPLQIFFSMFLVLILVILNWNYFRPEGGKMGPLTDEIKFTGAAWELQQTAGIYDYLPVWADRAPQSAKIQTAEIMEGEGEIRNEMEGTYYSKFDAKIESSSAKVRINTFYFPGWKVFVKDGMTSKELAVTVPEKEEEWGRMWVDIPEGDHFIYAQFYNTPVRTYSNIVSLAALVLLITSSFWTKRSRI